MWLPLSRATVDRRAERRTDEEWLAAAWCDPGTRVLVVQAGRALVDSSNRLILTEPAAAPEGERYLLGVEDGAAYFAVPAELPDDPPEGLRPARLRDVAASLDDREAGLMAEAVALERWHARHPRCPRCGAPTRIERAGYMRVCPEDGSEHFPRVDPAVIMLVRDAAGRVLLARKPDWPTRRFSILAGFVEPGESLEQAVAREVEEEVSLRVTGATYMASQPWPFPASLMLGFMADTDGAEPAADGEEIVDALWLTRGELREAAGEGSLLLPPTASIARSLIEEWYGGPLPSSW